MDINVAVNEALKAEISKAVSKELEAKKIDVDKEVKKYLSSALVQKMIAKRVKADFEDWLNDYDFFDDLPDKLLDRVRMKAVRAVLK